MSVLVLDPVTLAALTVARRDRAWRRCPTRCSRCRSGTSALLRRFRWRRARGGRRRERAGRRHPRARSSCTTTAGPGWSRWTPPPASRAARSVSVPAGTDWAAVKADVGSVHSCTADDVAACTVVRGGGPHVLVVGDSHAQMLAPMFTDLAERHDLTLSLNITAGLLPGRRTSPTASRAPTRCGPARSTASAGTTTCCRGCTPTSWCWSAASATTPSEWSGPGRPARRQQGAVRPDDVRRDHRDHRQDPVPGAAHPGGAEHGHAEHLRARRLPHLHAGRRAVRRPRADRGPRPATATSRRPPPRRPRCGR